VQSITVEIFNDSYFRAERNSEHVRSPATNPLSFAGRVSLWLWRGLTRHSGVVSIWVEDSRSDSIFILHWSLSMVSLKRLCAVLLSLVLVPASLLFPKLKRLLPNSSLSCKYEKYKLPNGLEVILHEDHRLPLVAVNLWYHVGPANELPGRTGFAHLFEHMISPAQSTSATTSTSKTWRARAPARSTAPSSVSAGIPCGRSPATALLRVDSRQRLK